MAKIFSVICRVLCLFFFLVAPGLVNAQLLSPDPLYDGAERGNYADVKKALLTGSSPNVRGGKQITALIAAARAGAVDVVELLLEHDAIPDLVEDEGNTALIHAALNNFEEVVKTLLAAGASINRANKQGETALMRAAGAGSEFTVATLLLAGADHTLTDFTGRTAFDLAWENRRNRVLEIFRNARIAR